MSNGDEGRAGCSRLAGAGVLHYAPIIRPRDGGGGGAGGGRDVQPSAGRSDPLCFPQHMIGVEPGVGQRASGERVRGERARG